MAVAYDTGVSGTGNGVNSLVLPALTTSAARAIIVATQYSNSSASPVTSVTGGSLTFTQSDSQTMSGGTNGAMEYWVAYASSALSAVQFTINYTGSNFPQVFGAATAWSGTATSSFIGAQGKNVGFNTTQTQAVTTTIDNSLVCAFLANTANSTYTAGTGQTLAVQNTLAGGFASGEVQYTNAVTATSGTSVTMSGTSSSASPVSGIFAFEIKPPASAATTHNLTLLGVGQ